MEQNNMEHYRGVNSSRIWSGVLLLGAGFLLLAYKMGAPIPGWIFTWPMLLIAIGLLTGVKSRFHNPGSFILILIGGIFLVDRSIPGINFHNYIVPAILIGIGMIFILRPKGSTFRSRRRWSQMSPVNNTSPVSDASSFNSENTFKTGDDAEYLNVHAVFGGVKKNIVSKNFKGGEIISFMGGAEINFMQADIQHPVVIEVNNVFGGTKLIIPSNWDVKSEISAVFGGVEDKRNLNNSAPDSNKRLLLKGACVFGGIEVANY